MLEILPAKIEDSALILRFIKELAVAEKFPFKISVTQDDLEHSLFGLNPDAESIICYLNKKPCGFAVFYHTYSTTTGKRGLHLEDLYIEPDFQGQGIGKKVLVYLAKLATKRECSRFEWWVLNTNDPAIQFYQKLGATKLDELSVFRLDTSGINSLMSREE